LDRYFQHNYYEIVLKKITKKDGQRLPAFI